MESITQTDKDDFHYKFKVVVLGDIHCGKSTFLDSKQIIKINHN